MAGGAPRADREYLLRVCGGERAVLKRCLEAERTKWPDLDEAALYRRAIRTHMLERESNREI
jgi:hypothetical protein